ncbi:Tim44 domain-containing protein [Tepidimonas charontis]|nr:Tim44-like domain-containing protein [Tepidimonas charontis]
MKTTTWGTWVLAAALVLGGADAWAKRLGGGGSIGKQSSNVVQRSAPAPQPPAPAPAQRQPQPGQQAQPGAQPAPAAAPARPWGAMLGGLAAGLGLAWLASALGFGEAFAQFLLIVLLAALVLVAFAWLRRGRAAARRAPLALQGAAASPLTPRGYEPSKVGNDASARPWERTQFAEAPGAAGAGTLIGSALAGPPSWRIPADFDVDGFLRASKDHFVRLQAAWDRGDVATLRALMTDEMLAQIEQQLAEREAASAGTPNVTEVVSLDAQLLGIEDLGDEYMASVEFSGLIRENPAEGPAPFREVWNITRPKQGRTGWLVAGVQALQ